KSGGLEILRSWCHARLAFADRAESDCRCGQRIAGRQDFFCRIGGGTDGPYRRHGIAHLEHMPAILLHLAAQTLRAFILDAMPTPRTSPISHERTTQPVRGRS